MPADLTEEALSKTEPHVLLRFKNNADVRQNADKDFPLLLNRLIFFSGQDMNHNFAKAHKTTRRAYAPVNHAIKLGHIKEVPKLELAFWAACTEAELAPLDFTQREQYVQLWQTMEDELQLPTKEDAKRYEQCIQDLRTQLANIEKDMTPEETARYNDQQQQRGKLVFTLGEAGPSAPHNPSGGESSMWHDSDDELHDYDASLSGDSDGGEIAAHNDDVEMEEQGDVEMGEAQAADLKSTQEPTLLGRSLDAIEAGMKASGAGYEQYVAARRDLRGEVSKEELEERQKHVKRLLDEILPYFGLAPKA